MLLTPYPTNKYHYQYVNMIDLDVHFLDDCGNNGPSCPTASGLHATGSKCLTPSGEDLETRLCNLASGPCTCYKPLHKAFTQATTSSGCPAAHNATSCRHTFPTWSIVGIPTTHYDVYAKLGTLVISGTL